MSICAVCPLACGPGSEDRHVHGGEEKSEELRWAWAMELGLDGRAWQLAFRWLDSEFNPLEVRLLAGDLRRVLAVGEVGLVGQDAKDWPLLHPGQLSLVVLLLSCTSRVWLE